MISHFGDPDAAREAAVGDELPVLLKEPTNVTLFMYSAAIWLTHRIHYDYTFATVHDGLPDLVVHGTLATDWLCQMLEMWAGPDAQVRNLRYRNSSFMVPNGTIHCGARVIRHDVASGRIDLEVWIQQADRTVVSGNATVELPAR